MSRKGEVVRNSIQGVVPILIDGKEKRVAPRQTIVLTQDEFANARVQSLLDSGMLKHIKSGVPMDEEEAGEEEDEPTPEEEMEALKVELEELEYDELQEKAQELNIPANQSTEELINAIAFAEVRGEPDKLSERNPDSNEEDDE